MKHLIKKILSTDDNQALIAFTFPTETLTTSAQTTPTKRIKKGTKVIYLVMFLAFLSSCNLDFKESVQVSLNIKEAKEKKVFVAEYKLANIQQLNSNYIFPIQSVWEEKSWHLALDKNGDETFKLYDNSSNKLVFQLNDQDTLITNKNYTNGKWIMWMVDDPENLIGSIRGMINLSLLNKKLNNTTSIIICSQKDPYDVKNNLTTLFKFDIVRH